MKTIAYDTDSLRLGKEVREKLAEAERQPNGCLIFAVGQVRVERRDGGGNRRGYADVEVQRIAYALTHPETHVRRQDRVEHRCAGCGDYPCATGGARRNVCIEPSHLELRKGEEA